MLKGWRTIIYNGVRTLMDSGIIALLLLVDWETAGFSSQFTVWLLLSLSLFDKGVNMWLRSITTTAVGKDA